MTHTGRAHGAHGPGAPRDGENASRLGAACEIIRQEEKVVGCACERLLLSLLSAWPVVCRCLPVLPPHCHTATLLWWLQLCRHCGNQEVQVLHFWVFAAIGLATPGSASWFHGSSRRKGVKQ